MKDILLTSEDRRIECIVEGSKITYTYSDDPRCHYVETLRSKTAYKNLKQKLAELQDFYGEDGYDTAAEFLQTVDCHNEFFVGEYGYCYYDMRDREEIGAYLDEASDKVWLMRSRPCSENPAIEKDRRAAVQRILETYDDIPKRGYSDWECGYWNGILGALRWVLGDEKDFLDT